MGECGGHRRWRIDGWLAHVPEPIDTFIPRFFICTAFREKERGIGLRDCAYSLWPSCGRVASAAHRLSPLSGAVTCSGILSAAVPSGQGSPDVRCLGFPAARLRRPPRPHSAPSVPPSFRHPSSVLSITCSGCNSSRSAQLTMRRPLLPPLLLLLRRPSPLSPPSQARSPAPAPSSAHARRHNSTRNPHWLSDRRARLGRLFLHGTTPAETHAAGVVLGDLALNWRCYVAGAEGYLTAPERRELYRHSVAWGDMVFLLPPYIPSPRFGRCG